MQLAPCGVLGIIKSSYTQVSDCSLYDIYTSYNVCVCVCVHAQSRDQDRGLANVKLRVAARARVCVCVCVSVQPSLLVSFSHVGLDEGVRVGHERCGQRGEVILAVGAGAELADV